MTVYQQDISSITQAHMTVYYRIFPFDNSGSYESLLQDISSDNSGSYDSLLKDISSITQAHLTVY